MAGTEALWNEITAAPFFGGADPLKVSYFLGFICILVLEIRGINAGNSAHPEAPDCKSLGFKGFKASKHPLHHTRLVLARSFV